MSEDQAAAEQSTEKGSILVVDPDPMLRNLAEDLEDELDRQVVAMDSVDFDLSTSEEIQAAGIFIIAWNLGIRTGVDLIESIRRDERLGSRPIIVALDAPTPSRVAAALAVGADTVCHRPYDVEEVRERLQRIESEPLAAAS